MAIDWFTILAQSLNFLILVWLMKRFLYKPILNAIDARGKKAAAELADIEKKNSQVKMERVELQKKNEEFDQQRSELLNKAVNEAKGERRKILEDAGKTAIAFELRSKSLLKDEEQKHHQELESHIKSEVFAIARKALADLSGSSLEERIVPVFLRRLRDLSEEEKKSLSGGSVVVRTSLDLSVAQSSLVKSEIEEILGKGIEMRFQKAPVLIGGIELSANGQKVSWSIEDYLARFERSVLGKSKDESMKSGGHAA